MVAAVLCFGLVGFFGDAEFSPPQQNTVHGAACVPTWGAQLLLLTNLCWVPGWWVGVKADLHLACCWQGLGRNVGKVPPELSVVEECRWCEWGWGGCEGSGGRQLGGAVGTILRNLNQELMGVLGI